jgi:hypothetical protein
LVAGLLACVSITQAAPVLVDFTDGSKWSAANGQSSFTATYGDVDVTASATGGNLSFNGGNDKNGCISGLNQSVHNLVCDGDGLGINNDEITEGGFQKITIMFSKAVSLNDIELLDLFNNSNEVENALVRLNGGIFGTHVSNNLTGGYHRTLETGSDITMVVLKSADDNHSDYALARISFTLSQISTFSTTGVPAPPAILLMIPGVAWLIRRRRAKQNQSLPVSRWFWDRPSYMGWA